MCVFLYYTTTVKLVVNAVNVTIEPRDVQATSYVHTPVHSMHFAEPVLVLLPLHGTMDTMYYALYKL